MGGLWKFENIFKANELFSLIIYILYYAILSQVLPNILKFESENSKIYHIVHSRDWLLDDNLNKQENH